MLYVCIRSVPSLHALVSLNFEQSNMAPALVRADVLVQDGLLPEVLPALRALVRLLTGVNPEMLVQDRPLSEGPLAVHARVRFFIGVDPQVLR